MLATTPEKVRSGTLPSRAMSPRRYTTGASGGVREVASAMHSGLASMPTTMPSSPTTRAAARAAPPDPQPRSSTWSPDTRLAQATRLS